MRPYDEVVLIRDVKADRENTIWPTGTLAVVVDMIGSGEMILERTMPAPELEGGLRYETAYARCSDVKVN